MLTQNLQKKIAKHGVKIAIPGLETLMNSTQAEVEQKGLAHILAEICRLELNGNLYSELEQVVTREKLHLQEDSLLNGLLDCAELKTCVDVVLENTTSHKMKIIEVTMKQFYSPTCSFYVCVCVPHALIPVVLVYHI